MLFKTFYYIFISLWKIEDILIYILYRNRKYSISRFSKGNGLFHKFILINVYNKKKYLIKKPTLLTDLWQWFVFRYFNCNSGYISLSQNYVAKKIKYLLSFRELSNITPCLFITKKNNIVYKLLNEDKLLVKDNEIKRINTLLAKYNLTYLDNSVDNFIVSNNKVYLIDLESIEFGDKYEIS